MHKCAYFVLIPFKALLKTLITPINLISNLTRGFFTTLQLLLNLAILCGRYID